MHISQYIRSLEVQKGIVGVYNPFGQRVEFLDFKHWNYLKRRQFNRLPGKLLNFLVSEKFVVEEDFEDEILNEYPVPKAEISVMWLLLTRSCNMACGYCVARHSDPGGSGYENNKSKLNSTLPPVKEAGPVMMSRDVAKLSILRFLDFIAAAKPAHPTVILYGGEPLLNESTARYAISLLRKKEGMMGPDMNPIKIVVITNGLIYHEKLTDFFKKSRVAVCVSIDGTKQHHDAVRLKKDGKSSYHAAASSLIKYRDAGLDTSICCTIGKHNYNQLPQIAEHFTDRFGVAVQFQVPLEIPAPGKNPFYVSMSKATKMTFEAFHRLSKQNIEDSLILKRMHYYNQKLFNHRDCGAVGSQVVVSPGGMIGPCPSLVHNKEFFPGDIGDKKSSPDTLPIFSEWRQRVPVNMPACRGCSGIALCGGGCPYNALVQKGSIWEKDPQQCDYIHEFIDWIIRQEWTQLNNKRIVDKYC